VGAVASGDQIHDFNPGIASSGLFWTIRIPDESVEVDFDDARASMNLSDEKVKDFGTGLDSLLRGPSVKADVSFHIRWSGVNERVETRDTTNLFVGSYIEDTATIAWSAQEKGFKFVSDPANTSTTIFAQIGRERNGVFFQ
jgi:hypothetical protein